jgi:hypothetical protein
MSQKVHSYVINLFGTAIQTWVLAITPPLKSEIDRLRSAFTGKIQHFNEIFDLANLIIVGNDNK